MVTSDPQSQTVRRAFRLSLEAYLSNLPEDADKLDQLARAHRRLEHLLYSTAITSADAVRELHDRAELAGQLDAAMREIRAELERS